MYIRRQLPLVHNPDQTDADGNGIGDACAMVPVDGQFAIAAAEPQSLYNDKMKSTGARLDRAIKADSKIGFRVASPL